MGTIASRHVRCPVCGTHSVDASIHDEAGMCTCPCGHRAYAGYVAELAALEARSGWLTERIREGQPPPPEVMGPYRIWLPPALPTSGGQDGEATRETGGTATPSGSIGGPVPPGVAGPSRHGVGAGVQSLLLSLGALMLIVAATIFAAVVWDRLGAFGQVAAMVVVTCGVAGLAVWLRSRLRGTAEALAVVAAGLLVVDVVAAPLLGLLPPRWLEPPTFYPALMAAAVGGTLIAAARRSGLRAWEWLGWGAVPVAGFLVLGAVDTGASPAVAVGLLSVPALASILMLARARVGAPVREPVAMALAGGAGLTMAALLTAGAVTSRPALPGALVTTVVATLAFWAWARMDRSGWVRLMAAALIGAAGAVMLLLPATQELWLAVLVAVAGLAAGALAGWFDSRPAHGREPLALSGLGLRWPVGWAALPTTAACTLWLCWSVGRTQAGYQLPSPGGTSSQVALLAATVAVIGFAAASRLPGAPWIAALLGEYAWLEVVAPVDVVEVATVPFAAMLLLAGLLWRRYRRRVEAPPSILWLGPAVTVALVPSALATWAAPWVTDWTDAATGPALLRLGVLLAVSVASVLAGARWGLAGLLLPASVALTIATLAQTWAGLEALPRWVGFGLAGTLLVVGGARIEWLRSQGDRAGTWLRDLH